MLPKRYGGSVERFRSATKHSFGSVNPPTALDECFVAYVLGFRSVTKHSSSTFNPPTEPNECFVTDLLGSSMPAQRCFATTYVDWEPPKWWFFGVNRGLEMP